METLERISGYTYGSRELPTSPVSLADFELLKKSVLFGDEDLKYLKMSGPILENYIEEILDVWYGFVGSHPHLLHYFSSPDGKPNADYLQKVRGRFGQWIKDTYRAEFDQSWLNYQHEIGLRHEVKKNKTDGVQSAAPIINFRYIAALIFPISFTLKPFLAKEGHSVQEVDNMYNAWLKAVLLQVILWSHPFIKPGEF